MAVEIFGVDKNSLAERAGIKPHDKLISINGHDITDILDFRFYETNTHLHVVYETAEGERREEKFVKPQYGALGLAFETYLMDRQRSCRNKCVFCFIDQLPPGMRETLYFKDDDDRLSFLFGNYITLTNIDEREIDRIIEMRISPINISVHSTMRCKMMHNRFAGDALRFVRKLAEHNIKLNCQIVLCPGLNDGEELEFTLSEMYALGESLQSVACVPVGVTRYLARGCIRWRRLTRIRRARRSRFWSGGAINSRQSAAREPCSRATSSTSLQSASCRRMNSTRTSRRLKTAWVCCAT